VLTAGGHENRHTKPVVHNGNTIEVFEDTDMNAFEEHFFGGIE